LSSAAVSIYDYTVVAQSLKLTSELFLFLDDFAQKGDGGEKRNNEHPTWSKKTVEEKKETASPSIKV